MCPHKDLAGTTSLSLSSGLGLLAGRRCYAVISLANPDTVVWRQSRSSKWEVVRSEWCPVSESCVAVAANNKGDSTVYISFTNKGFLYDEFQLTC